VLRVIEAPPAKPHVAAESPSTGAGVARVGDPGVTAPRLLSAAHPRYTDEARRAGIQGVAVVECVVGTDGTVGEARIVRSLDQSYGLDAEALAAARLYLFSPGTRSGKPIPVVVTLEMSFTVR
jgi:protein TonB